MRSARDPSGRGPPRSTEIAPLGRPLLLLNLKVYPECLGAAAEHLALDLQELGRSAGVPVAIAPAMPDVGRVARAVGIPVLAQHADPGPAGAHTGFVPAESIAAAGARGSLVNHSEHPLPLAQARAVVARLFEKGLSAIVCAPTVPAARRLAETHAPYVAIEPPELIGGHRAVSTARPAIISDTVASVRSVDASISVLCGAGVHDRADVQRALELGATGILVASAVTRASAPRDAIAELLSGF